MEIQQYWSVLKRRWLPAASVFGICSAIAFLNLSTQISIYQAEGKLRFTRGDSTASLTGVGAGGDFDPLIADNNPINTEMAVIRSIPIVQTTIDRLEMRDNEGNRLRPSQFLRHLSLNNDRGTDLLTIAYTDAAPETAKAVVDTLMDIYLENHLRENRAETVAARQFIEQQLPRAEASVQQAEAALRAFKEGNRVAALEEEAAAAVSAQEDLRRRIAEAQSELASANAQSSEFYNQLRMNPQEAIVATALSQSAGVQEVLAQLQAVESELALERVRFQEEHPMIAALESRRENLNAVLSSRVGQVLGGQVKPGENLQLGELRAALAGDFVRAEIRRRGLADQVSTLSDAQSFYNQRINALPRLEQEQRELERRLDAAQSTYALLLSRLHEIRVAENQNVGNARIIQMAHALDRPIAPRRGSYLAMAGMLSFLAAIATALLLEAGDKSLRSVKETRDLFGLTLLGMIPAYKTLGKDSPLNRDRLSEVVVRDFPSSPIGEAYRMLRVNLKFLRSDQALKTIVITSSVAHEGKSTVSANLAMAIAQVGHRVLLIDADMRQPDQHHIWHTTNDVGLSNLIVEYIEPTTVIQEVAMNLDLLTAGVTPPDPAGLLDSQQMATLIANFSAHYSYVIIDTPSLNADADVLILGKLADGILLVTQPGVVDVISANRAKERLEQSEQNVLGQVINGVMDNNEPYRYRYVSREIEIEDEAAREQVLARL